MYCQTCIRRSPLEHRTRNVCITKYTRLYKLSNGIMAMTPK